MTRREWILTLTDAIQADRIPPGDLAALRRLDPDHPSAAMWRVLAAQAPGLLDDLHPNDIGGWAEVLLLLATLGKLARRQGLRAGQALAEAGVSEVRVERLLRDARGQLSAVAHQLASQGLPVDPTGLALLCVSGPEHLEGHRMNLARDYYRARRTQTKESA